MVLELMKARYNKGLDPHLYYFRDAHGHEVDLIFQSGTELKPIEIKSSKNFHKDFLKNLTLFKKLTGERCSKGYLVYGGDFSQTIDFCELLPLSQITKIVS
jgi:predicted AAA+ superfamily ATPase